MNYIPQLLEVHNAAETRLDKLNDDMDILLDEQARITETLEMLLGEIESR